MSPNDCLEHWAEEHGLTPFELDEDGRFCLQADTCQIVFEPLDTHAILICALYPWRNHAEAALRELLEQTWRSAQQQPWPIRPALSEPNELALFVEVPAVELDAQSLQAALEALLTFSQHPGFLLHGQH